MYIFFRHLCSWNLNSVWAFYSNLHVYCNFSLVILRDCKVSRRQSKRWGYGVRNAPMLRANSRDAALYASLWKHMRSVRWNTTVCRPLYHGVPENSSTKKRWHTRCSSFCWANEGMFIHGPNMPTCLSGRDTWLFWIWSVAGLFCFRISFLRVMCSRSVYKNLCWHAALRQFR